MALQGEARKLDHREYMRRRRAGLPTRGVVKPMVMEQWCSECVLPPSPERIVISLGSGYRLCESCYEAAGALFAAERHAQKGAVAERRPVKRTALRRASAGAPARKPGGGQGTHQTTPSARLRPV